MPRTRNRVPFPLVLFCDDLSCERVEGAQIARIYGEDGWDRLDMFEPAIKKKASSFRVLTGKLKKIGCANKCYKIYFIILAINMNL